MAKITKQAAFLEQLHGMVTKEASAGKASGKPGVDTHPESVSKETEHVDKNKEGRPEHLPQEKKQEASTEPSDPTKNHKKASEHEEKSPAAPHMPSTAIHAKSPAEEAPNKVEQKEHRSGEKIAAEATPEAPATTEPTTNEKLAAMGQQLLAAINSISKEANHTPVGKPNTDVVSSSTAPETEHVDKNKEGKPEHLPQEKKQEPSHSPHDPTKGQHKAAEQTDLDKEASFELGRNFARTFLMSKSASTVDMYKEAGRRDFEQLIAQAAAELENEVTPEPTKQAQVKVAQVQVDDEALQIKQAEEAGAQAFYAMQKQAQEAEQANQIKLAFEQRVQQILNEKSAAEARTYELSAKIAAIEADMQKKAEDEKLDAKFAQWGSRIIDETINRLKNEQVPSR